MTRNGHKCQGRMVINKVYVDEVDLVDRVDGCHGSNFGQRTRSTRAKCGCLKRRIVDGFQTYQ